MSNSVQEDFPLFSGWPSEKVDFMQYNSCEQGFFNISKPCSQDRCYVVVRKEFQNGDNPILNCPLCEDRLPLVYDDREDEWVYEGAKEFMSLPYHYPTCYDYVKSNKIPKTTCQLCNKEIKYEYNHTKKKWTIESSREFNSRIYHYPSCYRVMYHKTLI